MFANISVTNTTIMFNIFTVITVKWNRQTTTANTKASEKKFFLTVNFCITNLMTEKAKGPAIFKPLSTALLTNKKPYPQKENL